MTDNDIPILSAPPPEHWDESFAQGLVGKTMLVNLTFLDADGELQGREAFYGVVITADAEEGVTSLAGDKPDFVANWIIHGLPDVPDAANDDEEA